MPAINLEKQIRRHVIARRHDLHAVTAPGMEAVCAKELAGLSETIRVGALSKGGVDFSGRLTDLYRANLHLHTAGRVLLRLRRFKASNFRQFAAACAQVPWEHYLPPGAVPGCKVSAHRSRLYHTGAIAQHLQQTIRKYWTDQEVATAPLTDDQTLVIRLTDDRVLLSLDSSGANLYRRGLKTHGSRAPLRETLAAAILLIAGYDPGRPLLDPMCGAGTFALEAALMAKGIAPGSRRGFACQQWPAFRPRQWAYLIERARAAERTLAFPAIHASDMDPDACRRLEMCVRDNGLSDAVVVSGHDFFTLDGRSNNRFAQPGLIVLNPPYGRRLCPGQDPKHFFHRLGAKLRRDFQGWDVALLVPDADLAAELPFALRSFPLFHGGLTLQLMVGPIGPAQARTEVTR